MILYSPYLTHRDPALWPNPLDFQPERFTGALPAWGYLPFSAGERTCLGAALASSMLTAAVGAFVGSRLARVTQDVRPKGIITLTPSGRMILRRTANRLPAEPGRAAAGAGRVGLDMRGSDPRGT